MHILLVQFFFFFTLKSGESNNCSVFDTTKRLFTAVVTQYLINQFLSLIIKVFKFDSY